MQLELKRIQKEVGITFVYVTHDQEEALTMSDRIAVMAQGQIEQVGPPVEVYERPASEFVAGFIGISNLLVRDDVRFVVRPEKLVLLLPGEEPPAGYDAEPGTIEEVVYVGVATRYLVRLEGGELLVVMRQNSDSAGRPEGLVGRPVRVAWAPGHRFVIGTGKEET